MKRFLEKLMKRWEVDSLWQVGVILVVFALTGMTALYVKKFFFGWMGLTSADPFWLRTLLWLLTVLPAYQVLFLMYGFLLGQFAFVWKFEKESLGRIKGLFMREKKG